MPQSKCRSSVFVFIIPLALLMGCGMGVRLVTDGATGGAVFYLYDEYKGHLLSSNRGEALAQIKKFCVGSYDVTREGQARGRRRVVEGVGGSEIIAEQWWGIRFQCKNKKL